MMRRGVLVDRTRIPGVIEDTRSEMMNIWHQIRDRAGHKINLDSPKQVNTWLKVNSSAEKALKRMRQTEDVRLLIRYRKLSKGVSSYYTKMMTMSGDDGVLRCDMRLHGTISGRLAVRNPPLQSLPTDTSLYRVKSLIVARPGYEILQADYSQAEVKIACHYGKELEMAKIIRSGTNMHDVVSTDVGISRDTAKRLNFSVIYGIGAPTLARELDITEQKAVQYLSRYHAKYPGFKRLYNSCEAYAKRNGYIDTYTGRRRHYNAGYSTPEHKASSNLVQTTVAEVMRVAQTRLQNELVSHDVHQILQVHDSAIMEIPKGSRPNIEPMVRDIMEIGSRFILPMTVDIGVGTNMEDSK
jgi:DNA polymerase-1